MGQTLTNECHYTGPTVPARPRRVLSPDATLTHPSRPGWSHQVRITAQASLRSNKLVPSLTVTDNSFWPPCYTACWFRARSICCLLPRYNVCYYTRPCHPETSIMSIGTTPLPAFHIHYGVLTHQFPSYWDRGREIHRPLHWEEIKQQNEPPSRLFK